MHRRRRPTVEKAVPDVWRREVGALSSRNFALRLGASEDLIWRFEIVGQLQKHLGCVNTVSFSSDGDTLVSGSDDLQVILWDWQTRKVKLSFDSGHVNNIFQAKFMPYSDDRSIVTSGADGQVRHVQILDRGKVETLLLAEHEGRVHKLAIEPGSPHIFYSCGEDGLVQHFDLRIKVARELFTCRETDSGRSYGLVHLNAIAMDPRNPNLFAVAGSDQYARLYDIRNYRWNASTDFGRPADHFCAPHLVGDIGVGITGLAFSEQSELLVSYNDEFIYLFDGSMGLGPHLVAESDKSDSSSAIEGTDTSTNGDADQKVIPQAYKGHRNFETVKGVGFFGPKCEYVVSGSDCGRIFIWKKKGGKIIRVMEADRHVVNCIQSHPYNAILASSGIGKDIKIWAPGAVENATLPTDIEEKIRHHDQRFGFMDYQFCCSDEGSSSDDDYEYDNIYCDSESDSDSDDDDDEDNDSGGDDIDDCTNFSYDEDDGVDHGDRGGDICVDVDDLDDDTQG